MLPTILSLGILCGSTAAHPVMARHPSGVPISTASLPITGAELDGHSSKLHKRWYGAEVGLYGPLGGTIYTLPITIGNQNFTVRLDTGSSDLWVNSVNVTCPSAPSGNLTTRGTATGSGSNVTGCYFKSAGYDPSTSPSFHPSSAFFNQTYTGGAASGPVGFEDVTVAGITVSQQEFAYVDVSSAIWGNVYTNDGIFGLAPPSVEAIYSSPNGSSLQPYDTWFVKAVKQNGLEPYFTIDLAKPTLQQRLTYENISNYGTVTLGGVPTSVPWSNISVTVPNVGVPAGANDSLVFYWAVNVTAYDFATSLPANESSTPYSILDSGTAGTQLPIPLAQAWHQQISPPGQLLNGTTYVVLCNATIPDFTVTIGGTNFTAKGNNFITSIPYVAPGLDEIGANLTAAGICYSGVQALPESTENAILGDNFLWDNMFIANTVENQITLIQKDGVNSA